MAPDNPIVSKNDELPMRLTRLRVKNFRSIAEMDIPLSPLTVLVGPNGSGKSNVVDALRFVRDIFTRGLDQAVMDREGMNVIQRWGSEEEGISIGLTFLISEEQAASFTNGSFIKVSKKHIGVELDYHFSINKSANEDVNVLAQYLKLKRQHGELAASLSRRELIIQGELNGSNADLEPKYGTLTHKIKSTEILLPNLLLQFLKNAYDDLGIHEKVVAFSSRIAEWMGLQYTPSKFQSFIENSNFYTLNPADLRQPQQTLKESPFDEKGRNMAAVLRRLKRIDEQDWESLRQALQQAVAGFENIEIEPVGGYLATKLTYQSENTEPRTSYIGQESDGTIRMLGLLTALYQDPQQPFIAIEEPEANIHPGALAVLAGALDQASLRSQIVLTTHSPDILDQLPVESFLVVEKIGDATRVGPLDASQVQSVRKKLFTAGELLRMEGLQRQPEPNETA